MALVVNKNVESNSWSAFTQCVSELMQSFENNDVELETVDKVLADFHPAIDGDIIDFVFATMTEIGGSPGDYAELLKLMKDNPEKSTVLRHMNS